MSKEDVNEGGLEVVIIRKLWSKTLVDRVGGTILTARARNISKRPEAEGRARFFSIPLPDDVGCYGLRAASFSRQGAMALVRAPALLQGSTAKPSPSCVRSRLTV